MSDLPELSDADFAAKMRGLINEAERKMPRPLPRKPAPREQADPAGGVPEYRIDEAGSPAAPEVQPAKPSPSVSEMLRPLVQGVQAVGRATTEHTQLLQKIDQNLSQAGDLSQVVTELRSMLDSRGSISRQMFDALHEELRSYKDGFLLDTVHRPMIRDLITLYDDLSVIQSQLVEALNFIPSSEDAARRQEFGQRMENLHVHIEHKLDFILEVLARLEVQKAPKGEGKLDKQSQKAVSVEMAEDPSQDLEIVRSLKCGFLWKDRVVRPEEVVIKKWKEGFLMALSTPSA